MKEVSNNGKGLGKVAILGWVGGSDGNKVRGEKPFIGPDPEVLEKPVRRKFSAEYKLRIMQEADISQKPGHIGALLRREGLYSSHLATWRRQRNQGILDRLSPRKRGRKMEAPDDRDIRIRELEQERERLVRRLKKAEVIIEFQKKAFELLEIPLGDRGEQG